MEASAAQYPNVKTGEGYAVGHLDDLGEGPGFRKVRKGLDVTAFGVNAIVMPAGIESGFHWRAKRFRIAAAHHAVVLTLTPG